MRISCSDYSTMNTVHTFLASGEEFYLFDKGFTSIKYFAEKR